MSHPFDSSEPIPGITDLIEAQRIRYSDFNGDFFCRDCGSLVKYGWLSMHDGLHSAIGYPIYPEEES